MGDAPCTRGRANTARPRCGRSFPSTPLVIGVVSKTSKHPKVPPWEQELSAGASAMNIVHAAHALGYVANWLTGWMAFDRDVLNAFAVVGHQEFFDLSCAL